LNEPRRHHILAEAYQKQFSNNDEHVWVFDKETQKRFCTSTTNVTVRRDFNSALNKNLELDHSTVESFFSNFESGYPQTIKSLRLGIQYNGLLDHTIQFMLLQAMRSPVTRRIMSELILRFAPHEERELRNLGIENVGIRLLNAARTGDNDAKQKIGLQASGHFAHGAANILIGLWYRSVRIHENLELCTSDNPVTYFVLVRKRGKLQAMLPVPGRRIVCCFPLARDVLLVGDSQKPPMLKLMTERPSQTTNSRSLTKKINEVCALNAERTIIASSEKSLEQITSSLPDKHIRPTKLFSKYAKLGKEIVKLNEAYWGD